MILASDIQKAKWRAYYRPLFGKRIESGGWWYRFDGCTETGTPLFRRRVSRGIWSWCLYEIDGDGVKDWLRENLKPVVRERVIIRERL